MEDGAGDVRDHGVERVGAGDGRQAIRALDAGPAQHVLPQHIALQRAPAKTRVEVVESRRDDVDHRHLVTLLEETGCQLRAHPTTAHYDELHRLLHCNLLDLIRHVGDDDARLEKQRQAQPGGRLGVQRVVPPAPRHEMRHDDGDDLVGLPGGRDLLDVCQQRFEQQPIGGIQQLKPYAGAPLFPFLLELFGFDRIHRDIYGGDVVR